MNEAMGRATALQGALSVSGQGVTGAAVAGSVSSRQEPTRTVVVAPVARRYPLKDGVDVVPVSAIAELLGELG